jgi:hypothetical protein
MLVIPHEEPVLVEGVAEGALVPVMREVRQGGVCALFLEHVQPDKLEVQVVVGGGFLGHGVIEGQGVRELLGLVGCAQRAADILAHPATMHLVAKLFGCDYDSAHWLFP